MIVAAVMASVAAVIEPAGYWTGPMRGDTPATLQGAAVIDGAALDRMIARDRPVMIDVSPAEQRPAGVRSWLPTHRSIPGSRWLPGAGDGVLAAEREAALVAIAGARTGAVVVFCHPRCWASWNAAKRLVRAGFSRVYWYRDGIEGWQVAHATAVVPADPRWPQSRTSETKAPPPTGEGPVVQSAEKE
ncbi:MAG TPA: rhodanese-like domain-containing protein [Sphingomonas sp.]|jgi:PQQ-dependent catabolism-associated CXXCW motif protein|nr:rhodanese-like domain-containing protein [Sphingomonas sp.]